MKQTLITVIFAALLIAACTTRPQQTATSESIKGEAAHSGDSTIYGLACEGCTDSILVFLSFSGGDPDTFDIIAARQQHHVFGRPSIGDELAVVRNPEDSTRADLVINLERLKGEWCYLVTPKLKLPAGMQESAPPLPDSLRQKWLQPREYGFEIRNDYAARPIGVQRPGSVDEQAPVEYPAVKRYREWRIFNGLLLLTETRRDSLGEQHAIDTDTAEIVLLRRDSLVLRFKDTEQSYYRRKE